jgi:nucleoside-diphosphate-sugar epimerase
MTILVTGGTGLVGPRLLKRLVEAGVECRALVRAGKQLPAGVARFEGDVLDPPSLAKAVQGVSAIVHLAAVFRTPDTGLVWRVNLEGTRNLIDAAKAHAPDARFIMASTILVYNPDSPRPGREDDACDPKEDYPASKLAAEKELRESGLNWSILRLPFVYGDQDGHLESLPRYVDMLKWHPAKKLSMIHHRDIATAVNLALSGAVDGRIVNTVDEAPTSMYEVVELVGATMAPSSRPLEHPWSGHADGSLARSLGFQPTVATIYQAQREEIL